MSQPPCRYFSHDFEFEARSYDVQGYIADALMRGAAQEHRQSVEAARQACADALACVASTSEDGAGDGTAFGDGATFGDGTAAAWDAFHTQHASVAFFKPRRYLLAEFPQLAARGKQLTVLELGCGSGSGALPVLQGNPDARVVACDFSPAAVAAAQAAASAAGIPSSRFVAFCADPSACSPADFAEALAAAAAAVGWAPLTHVDVALAVFVLSAVPPSRLPAMLAAAVCCLRPGGSLLVRDYGIYDLPMLRFPAVAAIGASGRLFARQDGTLARFFDRGEIVQECTAAAAAAGVRLTCDDADWCCVVVRNRAAGVAMRRVFVHAAFTRTRDAQQNDDESLAKGRAVSAAT